MFRSPLRPFLVACIAVVAAGVTAVSALAAGTPPSNTSPPTISGQPVEGHLLVASPGTWTGTQPISFAYQWSRCDQSGANCSAITGAHFQSYRVTAADVGHTLRAIVTASNSAGTSTATSAQTAVIAPAVPVNTKPPTISGTAQEGRTLTASTGSWTGARPMTFVFTWHRCDTSGNACGVRVGSGQTYVVTSADVGNTLRVVVTATNRFGKADARSAATSLVTAAPQAVSLTSQRRSVVYGGRVQLVGAVSPARAGVSVAILSRRFGTSAFRHVATVSTAADGSFHALVKPGIRTTYRAQLPNGTSSGSVAVGVSPRLRLVSAGTHKYSVTVYAARSFVGKLALVQRWSSSRHAWLTTGRIHLRTVRFGATIRTSRVFLFVVRHGLKIRVRLPLSQSSTGYLPGTSNTMRT